MSMFAINTLLHPIFNYLLVILGFGNVVKHSLSCLLLQNHLDYVASKELMNPYPFDAT